MVDFSFILVDKRQKYLIVITKKAINCLSLRFNKKLFSYEKC